MPQGIQLFNFKYKSMEKNSHESFSDGIFRLKKVKRKVSWLMSFLGICLLPGNVFAQEQKVTLDFVDAKVSDVFDEINRQTGLGFVYNRTQLQEINPVTLQVENVTVDAALKQLLADTPFEYYFEAGSIVIRKRMQVQKPQQLEERDVKGVVKDEAGNPLPGVAVLLKGTTLGTATDVDGKYTLTLPEGNYTLVFSMLGMKVREEVVGNRTEINVVMQEDATEMDEVVVTGMFTRKANTYTGAVRTIKGEELRTLGNGNVLNSLKNIDPSFMMVENLAAGSDPNALPEFQMRGQTGFTEVTSEYRENPNQPLFILNGFEATLTKILDLDMNLVESVTLLKDATAKAIYGAKAANGVVVIETKRPEKGQIKVTYTGSVDIEAPDLSSYDLCNAVEKLEAERLAGYYSSESVVGDLQAEQVYSRMLREVLGGVDTYWLDKPLRVGVGHKHSLYLEGGDDYMLYGVNLSYNNVAGVMKGSGRKTLSGEITLSYRYKNLLFRNQLMIDDNKSNDSPYGDFSLYAQLNPYNRLYDDDGKMNEWWTHLVTEYNYLNNGQINTRFEEKYTTLTENFYIEYQALDNLRFTARLGVTKTDTDSEDYKPAEHTDFINYSGDQYALRGTYAVQSRKDNKIDGDVGVAYSFEKKKHIFFFNAQYTMSRQKYNYYSVEAEGLANDGMDHISMAIQYRGTQPTGGEGITRDVGFVGSMNYSFDDRYLFDANYRLSGSSDFGADKRWGHFYSFGVGWNMHNEKFMENVAWIDRIKLRASTGYTGSQGFSSYAAVPTMDYYQEAYNGQLGSYLLGLANSDLAWQRKYDTNVGIDLTFLNGSLNGRFDWYESTTKGTITSVTTPPSTGFASYTANLGEVENKGWEAYLNWRVWQESKSASYISLYASAASNTNTLKKVAESLKAMNDETDAEYDSQAENTDVPVRYEEGSSMSTIWVVKSLGIDPETGREVFVKKDGTLTYDWSSSDYIDGGDTRPKVSGNFGLNMEWHGIGLSAGFTWQLGGQMYNETLLSKVENADIRYNVDRRVFSGRWSQPGQIARFKSITDDSYTQPTSRFVEDYNTLTFSSLNLYYDFRECKFVKNSFLERMKASFYMNDIATISSVKTERGTSYPFARTFSFELQLTF